MARMQNFVEPIAIGWINPSVVIHHQCPLLKVQLFQIEPYSIYIGNMYMQCNFDNSIVTVDVFPIVAVTIVQNRLNQFCTDTSSSIGWNNSKGHDVTLVLLLDTRGMIGIFIIVVAVTNRFNAGTQCTYNCITVIRKLVQPNIVAEQYILVKAFLVLDRQ